MSVGLLSACQSDSSEAGTEVEPKKEVKQEIMKEVKQEYEFKDIEKMDKAKSFEEAFDNYFGHDRHFTAYAKFIQWPQYRKIVPISAVRTHLSFCHTVKSFQRLSVKK
ncbi:hypothetical protein LJR015_002661 [Peribacillus frigoritolerans]|uniref:hypothetical protein n=1 Tax=Peribacillus frigoritolerans TaxID=450367 RepID=UPI003ECC9C65